MKPANKAGMLAAEWVEPRAGTEGKAIPQSAFRIQGRADASQARERMRQAARRNGKEKFIALLHHVTPQALEDAFRAIVKKAAAGIDGVTWRDYEAGLERKLADLRARPERSVPGDAEPEGLHTQAGRRTTPAGGRRAGGQDRPARRGRRAERDLPGGFPRLQLRLPARAAHPMIENKQILRDAVEQIIRHHDQRRAELAGRDTRF